MHKKRHMFARIVADVLIADDLGPNRHRGSGDPIYIRHIRGRPYRLGGGDCDLLMPPKPTHQLLKELTAPKRPKVKPKKKQTKRKIRQKKQIRKKTVKINDTTDLTVVAKAMIHEGGTVADVGTILACQQAEGGEDWVARLKEQNLSIEEFVEAAKQRADIELVRVAVQTALGYTFEEGSQEWMAEYDESGKPTGAYLPGKKKTLKKHVRDTALLWNLLKSRMPQYFMDRKEIKIDKRVVELKADAQAEIREVCAGLLRAMGEPVVMDAEFVEPVRETE